MYKVAVLVGSIRPNSTNLQFARALEKLALGRLQFDFIDLGALPFYDETLWNDPPPAVIDLKERIAGADGVLFVTPEYNRSIPGVLKNAIDWASRYRPQPFNGKQGLLLSASPSMVGGNRGLWALRVPLEHLGARLYPDMFSLSRAHQALGADGRIANPTLQEHFEKTIECFLDQVEAAKHYRTLKKLWIEDLGEQPDAATDRMEHTPAEIVTGDAGDA